MRVPTLPIKKKDGAWFIDVPESLSATGKRYRPHFQNKKQAELERLMILQRGRIYGHQSHDLDARQRATAYRAFEILKEGGHEAEAIVQAVADYVRKTDQQAKSVTFSRLWEEYSDRREGVSTEYARDIQKVGAAVSSELGKVLVCDMEPKQLESLLERTFPTPHQFNKAYRTLRPAFELARKADYCTENPFVRIEKKAIKMNPVSCLTPEESIKILESCRDYTGDADMLASYRLDCEACLPGFAIMLFAGIRPAEITRLQWEDVHLEDGDIRIGEGVAKTRQTRIVPIADNLRAWLELTPHRQRHGSVTKARWGAKYKAVRYAAGISDVRDIMRHTFASYYLAKDDDVNATRAALGHTSNDILFRHYRRLVKRADAIRFWNIFPPGKEARRLKAI